MLFKVLTFWQRDTDFYSDMSQKSSGALVKFTVTQQADKFFRLRSSTELDGKHSTSVLMIGFLLPG